MHKFPIFNFKSCSELPYEEFDRLNFSIYILDFNWNFLFANAHAYKTTNKTKDELIGTNVYHAVTIDPEYNRFFKTVEKGGVSTITTISPITKQRVSVTGYPLEDCYYFAVSVLPDKQSLIDELRNELKR